MMHLDPDAIDDLEAGLAYLLSNIVFDPAPGQADSLKGTPERFIRTLVEQTQGYNLNPEDILTRSFEQPFDQMIVVPGIDFTSLCEHHLLPFVGTATVGYIPANGTVVGLSKIPRLVDIYARRLQLQERMTMEIADAMEKYLQPAAVGVIIQAQHQCMSCRGVRKINASMVTSDLRGEFRDDPQARDEFLRFMR